MRPFTPLRLRLSVRSLRRSSPILLLSAVLLSPLHAQTPDVDAAARAERQQREEQDRLREQQRRDREALRAPELAPAAPSAPAPTTEVRQFVRRRIESIVVSGADHLPARKLAEIVKPYEHSDMGVAEAERLLADLTRFYIDHGYPTTRAYLPEQDLSAGTLRVIVLEGRLELLEFRSRGEKQSAPNAAFPAKSGDLLNLRDLEQGIENLNRLPSNNATMEVRPGTRPGDSIVTVTNDPGRPWRGNFSIDNSGSRDTGREQVSLSLMGDNFLGLADSLTLTHRRSLEYHAGHEASAATSGSISVPWGYQMFTLGGSVSNYALTFAAPSGRDLPFTGDSSSVYFRTDRVVYRNRSSRLSLNANLTWRSAKNYLLGNLIGVSSREQTVLDLGADYSTAAAGGLLGLNAGVSFGLPWFGGLRDASGLPDYAPRAQFTKLTFGANFSRSFLIGTQRFVLTTGVNGQKAFDVLYGSDQLTIGGLYAVRGFDRSNLAADTGYVIRTDLAMPLTFTANRALTFRPYVGLDQGYGWSNMAGLPGFIPTEGSLSGATVGASLTYRAFSFDFSHSRSLGKPGELTRESGRTYVRGNYSF